MATKIIPKKSSVVSKVPLTSDLEVGEIAINLADKKIYSKDSTNQIVELGGAGAAGIANVVEDLTPQLGGALDAQGNNITDVGAITADSIQLIGGTGTQGTLSWNVDEETLDLVENGTTLQLGQETVWNVKNQTGSTIAKGVPVMATGTVGTSGRITVAPMDGTNTANVKYFLGVTTEELIDGADGKVTHFGKIRGLNTSTYSEGAVLYLSTTTAGAFQTTEPTSGVNLPVAFVVTSDTNNGVIAVRVKNIDINAFATAAQGVLADSAVQPNDSPTFGSITVTGTVDGRDIAADGTKLDGIETGATADQTPNELLTAIKTVDGAGSGLDADTLDGTQLAALTRSGSTVTLTGAVTGSTTVAADGSVSIATTATSDPTLTINGDASGSATFTNLGNATLTLTIADDSHNHIIANVDGLQAALDSKLDDTQKGAANGLAELDATGKVPASQLPSYVDDVLEYTAEANFPATGETGKLYVALDTNDVYRWSGTAYIKVSDAVSIADQATKLATARNIALTGAVTGNANFDGSGNINISTTATSDPTLTINGDASGSATFTNLGNATLTLTVADDSHNHVISNVDGLQTALDGKLSTTGKAADSNLLDGLDSSHFAVRENSSIYQHPVWDNRNSDTSTDLGNRAVAFEFKANATDGLSDGGTYHSVITFQQWNDGSGGNTNQLAFTDNGNLWTRGATIGGTWGTWKEIWSSGNDGAGSGLDADLLDGQQGSYYYPASNPNGYTTNVGDITGVTAGTNITGGGTSGTVTVSVVASPTFTTVTATDFNTTSDAKLKENITTIESALDKVVALRGVEFDWKDSKNHTIGFIAQEVEKIVPELVDTNKETHIKSVKYGNITALLVEAIKELKAEITDLKSQLKNK